MQQHGNTETWKQFSCQGQTSCYPGRQYIQNCLYNRGAYGQSHRGGERHKYGNHDRADKQQPVHLFKFPCIGILLGLLCDEGIAYFVENIHLHTQHTNWKSNGQSNFRTLAGGFGECTGNNRGDTVVRHR